LDALVLQQRTLQVKIAVQTAGAQPAVSVDHTVPGHVIRADAHGPTDNACLSGIAKRSSDLPVSNDAAFWHPLH